MADETYIVELVAEPQKFGEGVRKAVADLNKIEATGKKIAANEKAQADAATKSYQVARARRDAAFSELSIVQKLVALEQRRAQLISFMTAAIASGNTRRQALLGQGIASVSAGSYLLAASNPRAAREATTIFDTGVPSRGGRQAGRRAPIALIGPPGDAGGRSIGGAIPPVLGGAKGPGMLDAWFASLGIKSLAKFTGAGAAIGAITGVLREIASWPGLARESSTEAKRVEESLKSQFEWSRKTRDNLAGLANAFTGIGAVFKQIVGTNLASYVELSKLLLRQIPGVGKVVDKIFPNTDDEKSATLREMELRHIEDNAQADALNYFKAKAKERQRRSETAADINATIPGIFSQDSRAKAGIYSSGGGEFWSRQVVMIQRQLLDELVSNTEATRQTTDAVKNNLSY